MGCASHVAHVPGARHRQSGCALREDGELSADMCTNEDCNVPVHNATPPHASEQWKDIFAFSQYCARDMEAGTCSLLPVPHEEHDNASRRGATCVPCVKCGTRPPAKSRALFLRGFDLNVAIFLWIAICVFAFGLVLICIVVDLHLDL